MFIRFFKTNQPASFLALPLLAVLLWAGSWINPVVPDSSVEMPFYSLISGLNNIPYLSVIVAFALIIFQAFYANNMINKYDLRDTRERSNFLTALFCIFFLSLFPAFRVLLPQHFSGIFLLLMLDRIFSSYRKEEAYSHCFDAGLLAGIASLFYFPSIVFFFLVWTSFIVLRSFNWREWVISFLGLLIPWLIVCTWYFLFNRLPEFFNTGIAAIFSNNYFQFGKPEHAILIAVFGGIFLLPSVMYFIRSMSSGKVRTNKFFLLFFWFLFFAIISGIVFPVSSYQHFSLAAIPLAIIFSNWFLSLKKNWVAESFFIILLGAYIYAEVMNLL